jgi:hypothetical protein
VLLPAIIPIMFKPTQALQILKRILWTDTNVYSANAAMKATGEEAVRNHYNNNGLERRGAEAASIRYLSSNRTNKET